MGSDPPLLSFNFRPDKTPRQTFENIMNNGFFTINHVDQSFFQQAHLTSAKYPKNISEFNQVGLEEIFLEDFYAPFVKQSKVQIAMRLIEHHHIKTNGTEIVIGEVLFIRCKDEHIQDDGSLNYDKISTVALTGLDTYYTTTKLAKLPYAHANAVADVKLNESTHAVADVKLEDGTHEGADVKLDGGTHEGADVKPNTQTWKKT